jgi:hypothetical protein
MALVQIFSGDAGATSHPRYLYGSSTRTIRNRTPISRRCILFTRRVRASDSRSSSDSCEILNQTLLRPAGILLWPPQSIDGLPNDLVAGNSRYITACRSIAAASCFSGTPEDFEHRVEGLRKAPAPLPGSKCRFRSKNAVCRELVLKLRHGLQFILGGVIHHVIGIPTRTGAACGGCRGGSCGTGGGSRGAVWSGSSCRRVRRRGRC